MICIGGIENIAHDLYLNRPSPKCVYVAMVSKILTLDSTVCANTPHYYDITELDAKKKRKNLSAQPWTAVRRP